MTQLWKKIKSKSELKFLLTGRFNQDVVENTFSTIRRKGGFRDNPSAAEFRYALRMVMVAELIKPALGANCAPDSDSHMLSLKCLSSSKKTRTKGKSTNVSCNFQYVPVTQSALNIFEQNTISYIAGYLCRKVMTRHEIQSPCDTCRAALLSPDTYLTESSQLFIHNKAYNTTQSDFGALKLPTTSFVHFCALCERIFRAEFDRQGMTRNKISSVIKNACCKRSEYTELGVCSEGMRARIVAIFVSMRIQYALKFKNRELKDMSLKRKDRKAQKVMHK